MGLVELAIMSLVGPRVGCDDPAVRGLQARHLIETRSQSLALSWEQVADLQERIRRERAKLLEQEEPQKPVTSVSHSDDFRSVFWYGISYVFTPTQAACIRVLWEAWERRLPSWVRH